MFVVQMNLKSQLKKIKNDHWNLIQDSARYKEKCDVAEDIEKQYANLRKKFERTEFDNQVFSSQLMKLQKNDENQRKEINRYRKIVADQQHELNNVNQKNAQLLKEIFKYEISLRRSKKNKKRKSKSKRSSKRHKSDSSRDIPIGIPTVELDNGFGSKYNNDFETARIENRKKIKHAASISQTFTHYNVNNWTVEYVSSWIRSNLPLALKNNGHADKYADILQDHDIDGNKLLLLDRTALEILGVSEFDIESVVKTIDELKHEYLNSKTDKLHQVHQHDTVDNERWNGEAFTVTSSICQTPQNIANNAYAEHRVDQNAIISQQSTDLEVESTNLNLQTHNIEFEQQGQTISDHVYAVTSAIPATVHPNVNSNVNPTVNLNANSNVNSDTHSDQFSGDSEFKNAAKNINFKTEKLHSSEQNTIEHVIKQQHESDSANVSSDNQQKNNDSINEDNFTQIPTQKLITSENVNIHSIDDTVTYQPKMQELVCLDDFVAEKPTVTNLAPALHSTSFKTNVTQFRPASSTPEFSDNKHSMLLGKSQVSLNTQLHYQHFEMQWKPDYQNPKPTVTPEIHSHVEKPLANEFSRVLDQTGDEKIQRKSKLLDKIATATTGHQQWNKSF